MHQSYLLDNKNKNIKLIIIEILMSAQVLNATKIRNILIKNYTKKVTYQGVHKALKELQKGGAIAKLGKEYLISDEYIASLEKFVNALKKSKKERFNIFEKKEVEKLRFENLFELYEFLINALSLKYFTDEYNENYFLLSHIWPLTTSVKPKKDVLHNWMQKSKTFAVISNSTIVDRIFSHFSQKKFDLKIKMNAKTKLGFELMIINDTVIQIFIPKQTQESVDKLFSGIRKIVSPDIISEITDIAFVKAPINVVIIRNKEIADKYKEEIKSYF